jgi:glutathione peroxidase
MVKLTRRALLALPLMAAAPAPSTAWDFRFPSLEGGEHNLAAWRGRVLLVVNTASFCGFTGQYAALQRLHDAQEAAGLVVLGVPSNDFNQESQDARKIKEFCESEYNIAESMISRIKNGERWQHDI